MTKPELLLPVGNIEAFYAAIEGGADAIYLGLKFFNARGRAANFNNYQLLQLLDEAKKHKLKIYVTLNTAIKNKEIPDLLDTLYFLSNTHISAVIIQDWGTFYLLKRYFPKLVVHASTQMANHNSAGLIFSKKIKFERVILARELTGNELKEMVSKSDIETEIFVHGALCYSFSGMCLFSSYLGGNSANRGVCTQPCRRYYRHNKNNKFAFSLKDNQLINFVDEFAEIGIHSLKIEGRLKSGEYVYQVASAYRKVIDKRQDLQQAVESLKLDMGRDKTQWFYAKKVSEAITQKPNTGISIGNIEHVTEHSIIFKPNIKLETGNRIRIKTKADNEQTTFIIDQLDWIDNERVEIMSNLQGVKPGHEVFLAGLKQKKFPNKLRNQVAKISEQMPQNLKRKIGTDLRVFKPIKKTNLFIRINHLEWLKAININTIDFVIIQLSKLKWSELPLNAPFMQQNKNKFWFEVPQFIAEKNLNFYQNLLSDFDKMGYRQFSLSHLSQKELLPNNSTFITNENVYCYNDAAAQNIHEQGAQWTISPFENEFDNLLSGANRNQIIPLYFYPKLFYSRQPVSLNHEFTDEQRNTYHKVVQDGITLILPKNPVSILQYTNKLRSKDFNQFLIDLSFEKVDKQLLAKLLNNFRKSEAVENTNSFNFKKGFK